VWPAPDVRGYGDKAKPMPQEQARDEAIQLYQQGVKAQALGDYGKAEESYRRCHLIMKSIGNRNGQAAALHHLGTLLESCGQYAEAMSSYQESYTLFLSDQDAQNCLYSLFFQSMLSLKIRESIKAVELLAEAMLLAFRLGPYFVQDGWSRVRQMSGVLFARRHLEELIELGERLKAIGQEGAHQEVSSFPNLPKLAQMTAQLGEFLLGCGSLWKPPTGVNLPEEKMAEAASWVLQTAVNLDQATNSGLSFTDLASKVVQEREG